MSRTSSTSRLRRCRWSAPRPERKADEDDDGGEAAVEDRDACLQFMKVDSWHSRETGVAAYPRSIEQRSTADRRPVPQTVHERARGRSDATTVTAVTAGQRQPRHREQHDNDREAEERDAEARFMSASARCRAAVERSRRRARPRSARRAGTGAFSAGSERKRRAGAGSHPRPLRGLPRPCTRRRGSKQTPSASW